MKVMEGKIFCFIFALVATPCKLDLVLFPFIYQCYNSVTHDWSSI
jgi:hypothetical protein